MAVGRVLDIEWGSSQLVNDSSHNQHEIGDVYAKGAILGAAFAQIAFRVGDDSRLFDKLRPDPAFLFNHFPQGLLDLAHRRIMRILFVGQIEMAGLRAQAAVNAGIHVCLQASAGLIVDHLVDDGCNSFVGQTGNAGFDAVVQCLGALFFYGFGHAFILRSEELKLIK